jgi:hypothetical protein
MAKEKNTQATEATVAKPIDELKAQGKLTLTANSREELFANYGELQADADGAKLSCGCVAHSADGNFVMIVTIN